MAEKSKKPTPAKENSKAKVEKTKKRAASPEVDHIQEDVSKGDAMENEVNSPADSDEEMAPGGVADPDGDDKKSTSPANTEPKSPVMKRSKFYVFVRCLNDDVTDADLAKFFESVGKVVKVQFKPSQYGANVRFEMEGLVDKALTLNNTSLKGWPAYVEPVMQVVRPKKISEAKLKKKEQKKRRAAKRKRKRQRKLMESKGITPGEDQEIKSIS